MDITDNTVRNQEILEASGIDFPECELEAQDYIWVEIWDNGFGDRGMYHLFDVSGNLKDIQIGKPIYLKGNNNRPKRTKKSIQGTAAKPAQTKKRGRPKKIVSNIEKPKKIKKVIIKKQVKKKLPQSDAVMQERIAAFLAKKNKTNDGSAV